MKLRNIALTIVFLFGVIDNVYAKKEQLPRFYCSNAKAIQPKSEFCEDNDIFVTAAERCLSQLKKRVDGESVKLLKSFDPKFALGQNKDYSQSTKDHILATQKLDFLIALTKQSMREIDSYFDTLYLPVDSEMAEVNGGDEESYIMELPCYSDTVASIDSVLDDTETILEDLFDIKKIAEEFTATIKKSEGSLESASSNQVNLIDTANQQKAPTQKVDPKKGQIPGDITGIEENEKKRKEAEKIIRQEAPKK